MLAETIRTAAGAGLPRRVLCLASSGHELGHLGLEHFLHAEGPLVKGAHAWVHLGANIGAGPSGSPIAGVRLQASDDELDRAVSAALAHAEAPIADRLPRGRVPAGEARNLHLGGARTYPCWGRATAGSITPTTGFPTLSRRQSSPATPARSRRLRHPVGTDVAAEVGTGLGSPADRILGDRGRPEVQSTPKSVAPVALAGGTMRGRIVVQGFGIRMVRGGRGVHRVTFSRPANKPDLQQGRRADLSGEMPGVPSAEFDRADVAHHLQGSAAVGAFHQGARQRAADAAVAHRPDVGVQKFKNDMSLTDEQIDTIVRWVDGGRAAGRSEGSAAAPSRSSPTTSGRA